MSGIVECVKCGQKNRVQARPTGVPRCGGCGEHLPWLVEADSASFLAETTSAVTVLVDFWAPWCGPCRTVGPVLEQMARELAGRLKVVKVNVDENPEIAARFQVEGVPTLVVIRNGAEVDRVVGAMGKTALQARIAPHLAA